jgi:HAD superfamily hydrolase (TIGR01450 family)
LEDYRVMLCDLDGCLVAGETVLPGARRLVARAGNRLWICSNNSTDTPATLAQRLHRLGLELPAERIVLAGTTALEAIRRRTPGARIAIHGSSELRRFAAASSLVLDDATPQLVLLARDLEFSYATLNRLIRSVRSGAKLVVANEDATHPGGDGFPVAETGALLAALVKCLPTLRFESFGKPEAAMYLSILKAAGCERHEVLAIGDNPETDGCGAERLEIDLALIGEPAGAFEDLEDLLSRL